MFTRKNLYWLFMMLLVLSCVRSGCGGSSGGDVSINGNNGTTQSQDITPTPETPTSPDNQSTPQTPTTPNTPTTTIPFTALTGTWQASNATGSATANGTTFTMTMSTSHANTVTFSGVTSSGTLQASSQIYWDANGNGVSLTDIHDNLGSSHEMTFQNLSANTWQMYRARRGDNPEITTITFTSATTAKVERDGYYDEYQNAHYKMTYTITKQSDSTTTQETPAAYDLNGTWRITAGTLTYENGTTANYVQGSMTADPFTIALSETGTGTGKYVLALSASSGGFKKEGAGYGKANFEGLSSQVRVVWGTSEDWREIDSTYSSTYTLTEPNTYHANYGIIFGNITEAQYQMTDASTVRYTQSGYSIDGDYSQKVNVELTLTRVN